MAPGVRGHGSVPLSHAANVVTKIGLHKHTHTDYKNGLRMKLRIHWLFCFRKYNG